MPALAVANLQYMLGANILFVYIVVDWSIAMAKTKFSEKINRYQFLKQTRHFLFPCSNLIIIKCWSTFPKLSFIALDSSRLIANLPQYHFWNSSFNFFMRKTNS